MLKSLHVLKSLILLDHVGCWANPTNSTISLDIQDFNTNQSVYQLGISLWYISASTSSPCSDDTVTSVLSGSADWHRHDPCTSWRRSSSLEIQGVPQQAVWWGWYVPDTDVVIDDQWWALGQDYQAPWSSLDTQFKMVSSHGLFPFMGQPITYRGPFRLWSFSPAVPWGTTLLTRLPSPPRSSFSYLAFHRWTATRT